MKEDVIEKEKRVGSVKLKRGESVECCLVWEVAVCRCCRCNNTEDGREGAGEVDA